MVTKKLIRDGHPVDPDRLFARPIIEYIGAFSSFNRDGDFEHLRPPQQRRRLIDALNAEAAETELDEKTAWLHDRLRTAVSELDAFDVIERVRKGACHG